MVAITQSVGVGGKNKPVDVMIVQHLLNLAHADAALAAPIVVSGNLLVETALGISAYQSNAMGNKKPDGRIDPGGKTFAKLAKPLSSKSTLQVLRSVIRASSDTTLPRPGEVSSRVGTIDTQKFLGQYDRQFVQLGGTARTGLIQLLDFINADGDVLDVGWAAYMLATVKHECAERWLPIKEFGLGAGKAYGAAITVTDSSGKKHTNVYFGRGYVQLTWKDNYKSMGHALGKGDDLMIDPDLALDPDTAYQIMTLGMRGGSFTTKKLSDFINQHQCNYASARQIINGFDQHTKIAGFANDIEMLLRVCCFGSISDSTF